MTTYTVKESGGDYSSLNGALTSVAPGDIISIEGTWSSNDNTACTIADDNLTITADSDSKHPGYWDTSQNHYRLVNSTNGNHALTLSGNYTLDISGVAIEQASTLDSDECFRCVPGTSDAVTITSCLFQCSNNQTDQDCIYTGFNADIGTVDIENCSIWGAARAGVNVQNCFSQNNVGTVNVNSCTIWFNGREPSPSSGGQIGAGVKTHINGNNDASGFTVNIHNSDLLYNTTGGSYSGEPASDVLAHKFGSGTQYTWNISYSIDSDNSISGLVGSGTGNLASRTATDSTSPGVGDWVIFEDITSSPYDLRLVDNAENDAQDMHTTDTAHGITIPSTDIVGTSRPQNTSHDVGAFEIVAAARVPRHGFTNFQVPGIV